MAKRVTVYLDDALSTQLNCYGNKSNIVKQALHHYFSNQDIFNIKINECERKIQDYEFRIKLEEYKIKHYQNEIERIEKIKNY